MSQLQLHIKFDPSVTSASAAFATQKYNKQGALCFQFDDGSHGILVADDIWQNYSYTDGCGNSRNYKGSVGMNRGTGVPGSNDYIPGVFTGSELKALIAKNHDIENHSYYHTGNTNTPPTSADLDNDLLSVLLEDDVVNKYAAYKMSGFIIPQNFTGFDPACVQLGYLSCISEGVTPFTGGSTVYQGNIPELVANIPDFFRLTRYYNDTWDDVGALSQFKNYFDNLISGSTNIYVLFTHSLLDSPTLTGNFQDLFNYFQTQANDQILFASLREVLEYTQMRKLPITQALSGDTLTISIDTGSLSARTRFMDCSFNITSDAGIIGVTSDGFDQFSFNPTTKLINAFKQKTIWGAAATNSRVPDAVQSKFVTHGHFVTD